MATTIRQEINILTSTVSAAAANSANSNEQVQLDTTQYVNPTYYFEVVYTAPGTITAPTVRLELAASPFTDYAITNLTPGTTNGRIRSSAFTPATGQSTLAVHLLSTGGSGTLTVKSARIIVIDSPTALTSTETQIEIGMNKTGLVSTTATKVVPDTTLTKYWKYTAANWDGTKTFYAEVTYLMASSKSSGTFVLQEDNGSFASWTDKVTIVNAGVASAATRVRSASFTPTDGRNYRIAYLVASSKSAASIFNAKIIVDQGLTDSFETINAAQTFGAVASRTALSQSLTTTSAYSVQAIALTMQKVGSPTDNIYIELLSGSVTGTILGTSANISGSTLTTSDAWYTFTFPSPISLSNATKYWIRIWRSGAVDLSNHYNWRANNASAYANGDEYVYDGSNWGSAVTTIDTTFRTYTPITLLEPQYLLLNTADSNVTGVQSYQTLWDSTEWSGVTNVYTHAMDSDNASNSAKLRDLTAGADITSTVTGANQQISTAITMPTTGHEIDTWILNTTGVVGADRIIVQVSVQSAAFVAGKPLIINQAVNRAGTY